MPFAFEQALGQAHQPLGQEYGDRHEQAAQGEQPGFRHHAGEHGLAVVHQDGADHRAVERGATAHRHPHHQLDGVERREFAGVDDAHLGHVQRPGNPGEYRADGEDPQLVVFGAVAQEAGAGFRVAHRHHGAAQAGAGDPAAEHEGAAQGHRRGDQQRHPGAVLAQREAEDVLEVGEAVVAAEAQFVAEERQHQRVGERLGDDRQIDAGDPRAERQPAEHERQHAGHQRHHQHGEAEAVEAVPVPGQLLPVKEHHEVRQRGVAVDAPVADLAHQVHAHGVAAQGEEGAVAEAEDAAVTPHQVQRQRQQGVAQVLAQQADGIAAHVQTGFRRHQQVEQGDDQHGPEQNAQEGFGGAVGERGGEIRMSHYSSAARPRCGNSPRGLR